MPVDSQFGVTMIYPNKVGDNLPKNWFMTDGWEDGPRIRLNEKVSGNGTDGYRLDDNSQVRMTVSADSKDVDIECDNDFAQSTKDGFVYKPNDWMGASNSGVEMTLFCRLSKAGPIDNPIIWKGPTGEHHSNTDCCSGSSHMVHVGGQNENLNNRIAMRLSKEMWHVNYHTRSDYKTIDGETWSILDNKWFGVKYIIWKATEGSKKVVKIEVYLSPNGSKTEWKKVLSDTDSGGWGSGGDDCNGKNDDPLAFGNSRMMWRWDHRDGNDLRFKWGSIRAIDPLKGFEQEDQEPDPVTPSTNIPTVTTFKSTLKLQRNINANTASCGLDTLQVFYEILGTSEVNSLVNHSISGNKTRRGQQCRGSPLQGIVIKQANFALQQEGTPAASPTVSCKIWGLDNSVKYTSPTTVAPNTLPTSFNFTNWTTFDFSTNTYPMAIGDRIGVEYLGTDGANYVHVWYVEPSSGSSTCHTSYILPTTTWELACQRDCTCQFFKAV